MSKENNLKDYLADLYQGIASKKPNASKNPQDFRAEIESISIGGINGIIEEYTVNAGATVTAGDFVEFVNAWNKGEIISTNPIYMSACKLDNTRVVIAYTNLNDNTSTLARYDLKVQVVKITNNGITVGNQLTLYSNYYAIDQVEIKALNDTKAVILCARRKEPNDTHTGEVSLLSIDGDAVIHSQLSAVTFDYGCLYAGLEVLTEDTFLVAYKQNYSGTAGTNTKKNAYILAYRVNGIAITKLDEYLLMTYSTQYYLRGSMVLTKLSDSKVLLTAPYFKETNVLYSTVVGFENGNITVGTSKLLSGVSTNYQNCALDENTAIVLTDNSARVAKIDGTNVTYGDAIPLDPLLIGDKVEAMPISAPSIVALSSNKVLVVFKNNSFERNYARVFTVDGTTLTRGVSTCEFDKGTIDINQLIAFSDNSVVNIFANEFIAGVGMSVAGNTVTINQLTSTYVQPATSRLHNVGVAKTAGSEGERIEVYVVGETS